MKKYFYFLIILLIMVIKTNAQSHMCRPIRAFASIYTVENSIVQSVPTGSTYIKVTCYSKNGRNFNCIADVTNDQIIISVSGTYDLTSNFSTIASTAGVTFTTALFVDETEIENIYTKRRWVNANDNSSASMSCQIYLIAGQKITARCKHDSGNSVDITVIYANLSVNYIGE